MLFETVFKQGGLISSEPQFLSTKIHGKIDVIIIFATIGKAIDATLLFLVFLNRVEVMMIIWMSGD